jgi:hypothetical protein
MSGLEHNSSKQKEPTQKEKEKEQKQTPAQKEEEPAQKEKELVKSDSNSGNGGNSSNSGNSNWFHECVRFVRTDHEMQRLLHQVVSIISVELFPYIYICIIAQLVMLAMSASSLFLVVVLYRHVQSSLDSAPTAPIAPMFYVSRSGGDGRPHWSQCMHV